MGNHHAEEDLERYHQKQADEDRAIQEAWDRLPAQQKVDALERRLAMINERAVRLRDQIGHGDVLADLRDRVHNIVVHSREYRKPL